MAWALFASIYTLHTDLQWEVGVFLLLSDLQAGQVGEAQLQLVLLFEVLHNTAIICVSRLHGQGEPVRVREWRGGATLCAN